MTPWCSRACRTHHLPAVRPCCQPPHHREALVEPYHPAKTDRWLAHTVLRNVDHADEQIPAKPSAPSALGNSDLTDPMSAGRLCGTEAPPSHSDGARRASFDGLLMWHVFVHRKVAGLSSDRNLEFCCLWVRFTSCVQERSYVAVNLTTISRALVARSDASQKGSNP